MAGRPSIYSDDILTKSRDYLSGGYEDDGNVIPSVAGLALHLGIARATVYDWAKQEEKKEFSDILESILASQEQILFTKGLTGDFNAAIVKLALGKHGYSDKTATELTGANGGPIQTDSVFEFIPVSSDD